MSQLNLTNDELLSTTRAVRRRLDFDRPVPKEVLMECLAIALQAPSGSNSQGWQFMFVTDQDKKARIAALYQEEFSKYVQGPMRPTAQQGLSDADQVVQGRVQSSAQYLADNLARAPVLFIPCISPRTDTPGPVPSTVVHTTILGSIIPAAWSFMLAARARGLGTCLTTLHLMKEREAAEILSIPYDSVMQVGLIPVAYTKGTDFKPAPRRPLDPIVHFDEW
ncbi:MAG: nitroreductase family protein [Gammaproteobacteria bacterium]|nr:nitroreductase family protein [Gammaproteobacteria bacterium]MCY4199801.1 nitroreductase family protein [Gammaproteobacteria bacterium]MCY4276698.1 nitroreductase family protein [Gammaproteobacteria bacterium]MCY4323226.1 nitroreductase family protein [Gammaproteobacteria bacterium]